MRALVANLSFALAVLTGISGCATLGDSLIVGGGHALFEVKQISKDEFELTLWGGGVHSKDPSKLDEPFDARARELCGGRRFLSNVSNAFVGYSSPGAFGVPNRHTGLRRSGLIMCQQP